MPIENSLDDLIMQIGEIPAMPKVAQNVIRMVEDPNTTTSQLQAVIDTDQAMASRLLKIANSAFYGYAGKINTTTQAVMMLGYKALKSILLAASLKGVYKQFGLTERLLWEHSLFTSISCRLIATKIRASFVDDAFVSGLMHNVGMVVMNNEKPDQFSQVIQRFYNDGVPLLVAEKKAFGFTHREVGALTVKKWRLSEALEKTIYYQYNPWIFADMDPYLYRLTSIVYLSNSFCYKLGIGLGKNRSFGLGPKVMKVALDIGINEGEIEDLLNKTHEMFDEETGRVN